MRRRFLSFGQSQRFPIRLGWSCTLGIALLLSWLWTWLGLLLLIAFHDEWPVEHVALVDLGFRLSALLDLRFDRHFPSINFAGFPGRLIKVPSEFAKSALYAGR